MFSNASTRRLRILVRRNWYVALFAAVLLAPRAATAQCTGPGGSCWSPNGTNIFNTNTGSIGFGTNAPTFKFDFVYNMPGFTTQMRVINRDGGLTSGGGILFGVGPTGNALTGAISSQLNGTAGNADLFFRAASGGNLFEGMRILANGNVGIGTSAPTVKLEVNGTVKGTNIQAQYQDLAEWVSASRAVAPGTVVVVDTDRPNHVTAAETAYDTRVAGVVSSQPGLVLGEGGEGRAMVSTTGRVRVRVDASRAPIKIGDLLVSSNHAGYAMRSEPIDIAGVKVHRPGTLIGKALEPLETGEGEILVLLSLQ